jgi:hypothetical protein
VIPHSFDNIYKRSLEEKDHPLIIVVVKNSHNISRDDHPNRSSDDDKTVILGISQHITIEGPTLT